MRLPRPAPDTYTWVVDDECLVFSAAHQEIHSFNSSGAFIWLAIQEGQSLRSIVAELKSALHVSGEVAAQYVEGALADWKERGLIAAPQGKTKATPPQEKRPDCPASRVSGYAVERCYRLLDSRLRIRFTADEQLALVHPILAHLADRDEQQGDHVIDIIESEDGIFLYLDGEGCLSCQCRQQLAPLVKGLIWSTAINSQEFFIALHAGVVCGQAGAILLPGHSGSGKSTLTTLLAHSGLLYFSDEFALLRDSDLHVLPVPLSFCIKSTGLDTLATRFPALAQLPVHTRFDGKQVVYLPPPTESLPPRGAASSVRAIVFPKYTAGAQTERRTLRTAESVRRLIEHCLVVHGALDVQRIETLINWMKLMDCRELIFGEAEQCLPLLKSIVQ